MKKIQFLWYVLTFLPILLLIIGYIFPSSFFSNQEAIRNYVMSYGIFAPIIFIVIQILQVVITPLSHYAISIAGGFIFGVWKGFIYNWIGRIIGTAIAFYLGKFFVRKILKNMVKEKTIKKYDYLFEKGRTLLFLAYFLPFFPDDELSYLAGISSMNPKTFFPIMMLGHIGGSLVLAYVGNGIESLNDPIFILISIATLIAGIWFTLLQYKKLSRQN